MMHMQEKHLPRSPRRVDLDRGHEVRYWTRQLGCSAEELHTAVARVGASPAAIKRALKRDAVHGAAAATATRL